MILVTGGGVGPELDGSGVGGKIAVKVQHRVGTVVGGELDRGIDQTSFLLADDGKSKREKVYMWTETDLMAMRMWEYKMHVKVVEYRTQWLDIDMSTKAEVGLAPWLFNLYIDPKEQYPVGHRLNAFLASMSAELKAHAATFKKYPPKDVGLGQ